jgi:TonB family protein
MKTFILASALLIGSLPLLLGSTDPAAQSFLVTAKKQASLFHDQAQPLQLDIDFMAQFKVPVRGHLMLKWEANDRWWRKISMGDFEQVDVRNGDKLYTSRNVNFTPVRIQELVSLLEFAEGSEGMLVKRQKKSVHNGVEISCLKVQYESFHDQPHEICINFASRDILSDEWQDPPDDRRKQQYTDYFDFEGHRYPRKLELLVNGIKVITANVGNLTTAAFDQRLLIAPNGAIERRQCADLKAPVPIKNPDPMLPPSASQNKLTGNTTVAMTVLADGSVTEIQLVGSAGRPMDDATLQTLKSWKFKPAMCGADPVVSDVEVVVKFRVW